MWYSTPFRDLWWNSPPGRGRMYSPPGRGRMYSPPGRGWMYSPPAGRGWGWVIQLLKQKITNAQKNNTI